MENAQMASQVTPAAPPALRPLSLGEILDVAISIYRKNWILLISIAAVIAIPLLLLQVVGSLSALPMDPLLLGRQATTNAMSSPAYLLFLGVFMLIALVQGIANVFVLGAVTVAVSERYLGRPVTVKQAYGASFRHWLSLLVASILIGLVFLLVFAVYFGLIFVGTVPMALLSGLLPSGSSGLVGLLMIIPLCILPIPLVLLSIFLLTRWAFSTQAIVLEGANGPHGMGRSWHLVHGSFWRVLFTLFVLWLLVYILTVVPSFVIQFAVTLVAQGSPVLSTAASGIASAIVSVLISPIQYAVMTILYYDLRIRKEGFDLETSLRQLEPVPMPPAAEGVS